MAYRRSTLLDPGTLEGLVDFLMNELTALEREQFVLDGRTLPLLYAEPTRLREGLLAFADGTQWNPGSGKGVYVYYNSTWNRLG